MPFAPETRASGVAETGFFRACWYGRDLVTPALRADERLVVHFGAWLRPWAVINAAAYRDVDGAEQHPTACFRSNASG